MRTKLTADELISAYRRILMKTRGAWYKHKFHIVGSGLEVGSNVGICGLGKVMAG